MQTTMGPFGEAVSVRALPVVELRQMYLDKCGMDIAPWFEGTTSITLYECTRTGYRFWRPSEVAGDQKFYKMLSALWPKYYQTWRWEYNHIPKYLKENSRVLEVGCGRGYFLRSIEKRCPHSVGLEFNPEAIQNTVTQCEIRPQMVESLTASGESAGFDLACSFHVLEHVVDPESFIRSCAAAVRPGGYLALSTPNHAYDVFRDMRDAFDLPPHHIGHFTARTFELIGKVMDLEVVTILENRRRFVTGVGEPPPGQALGRLGRRLAMLAAGDPGSNLMAVYRRRPSRPH